MAANENRRFENNWKLLIVLVAAAISLRLAFVFIFPQEIRKDAADYDRIAWNIATTSHMYPDSPSDSREILGRTPVYPVFLAAIYKLGGHSYLLARIIQVTIDVGMCILLFFVSRSLGFGIKPSMVALGLAAVNPFTSAYVGALISECLGTFLLVLVLYFLYLALKKDQIWMFILTGFLFGILTLCRPQFAILCPLIFSVSLLIWFKNINKNFILNSILIFLLVLLPYFSALGFLPSSLNMLSSYVFLIISPILLILWFVIPKESSINNQIQNHEKISIIKIFGILLMTIFSVLAVLPWTYRNYFVSGKFIPLVTSMYPSGGGWYLSMLPIPLGKDPMEVDERWKRFVRAEGEEQIKLGKEMEEIGHQRLVNKPHYFIWFTIRKAIRLWNQGNLLYSISYKEPRWVWGIFTGITFGYYLLAALGVWITRKRWRILFPLYVPFLYLTILCAPGHVESRYTIEAFPIVCIFGGIGLSYLWSKYKRRNISEEEFILDHRETGSARPA